MKPLPFRFWIGVMLFWTTFTNYMFRSNMSVSIINMVKVNESYHKIPPCLRDSSNNAVINNNKTVTENTTLKQKQVWTEKEVGIVLAGYFYGYQIAMLPGGFMSDLVGAWHTVFWAGLLSLFLNSLTPLSINGGYIGVTVNRAFIGFLGGAAFPACHTLVANWAPPKEKGKFLAAMMGNMLGTVVAFGLVGLVTDTWGWDWGFYVLSIIEGIFLVFFFFIVTDKPNQSKWTSKEEQDFIMEQQEGHLAKNKGFPPYLKMIASFYFWITCITQFGNAWNLNLNLTYIPKFLAETIGYDLKASAGIAGLPYFARLIGAFIFGLAGDRMHRQSTMTVTNIRKTFIVFSHFVPAACLFLMTTSGCSPSLVVIMLILNQFFNGACSVSILMNPQDLTPNFAASCYGLMNFVGMTSGIIVPQITGAINHYYEMELVASTIIFILGAMILIVSGVAFMVFGTAEIQPWNQVQPRNETQHNID